MAGGSLFDGADVHARRRRRAQVRQRMGMVFQNFELFPHLTRAAQRHDRAEDGAGAGSRGGG